MEEFMETGVQSENSVGIIDGVGVCRGRVSFLGGGASTDGMDFGGSSWFLGFEVDVVSIIGAASPIGNFYKIRVSPRERTTLSTACFGEMLIDTVDGVSLAEAAAFKKAPGGAPANVAVGIAAFVGKVGDDEFGYMLCDISKQNNVDNSGVCFDSKARIALTFVSLGADGGHEFMFFRNPRADMLLCESKLNKDILKKASVFLYVSVTLSEETFSSTQIAPLKIAKKAGCILSYDPNIRSAQWPLPGDAKKEIMSIRDQADIIEMWPSDYLQTSEGEISFLTDGANLVTEGSEGCRYYTKECKGKVCGVKVNCAGDAFVSGLLNVFLLT